MSENLDDDAIEFANQLFDGARNNKAEFVASAVRQGVPVNMQDSNGNTLLMLAAYNGGAETVAALADLGADVNLLNDRGQSPLAGAVFKRDLALVQLLLQRGADPNLGTPSAADTAKMFGVEL